MLDDYIAACLIATAMLVKWGGMIMQVIVTIQRGNTLKKGVQ